VSQPISIAVQRHGALCGKTLVIGFLLHPLRPRSQRIANEFDPQMLDVVERRPQKMLDLVRRDSVPTADVLDLEGPAGDELGRLGVVRERHPLHAVFEDDRLVRLERPLILVRPFLAQLLVRLGGQLLRVLQALRR
jgi:hypothetical protein